MAALERAKAVLPRLTSEYDRAYYEGVIHERWAKAGMAKRFPTHVVTGWYEAEYGKVRRSVKPTQGETKVFRKPKSEMTPQELIEEEAEMEDWTADLLTIAAGEEAMAKARAQQSDLSPPGGNVPSPEIPQSLFKSLEHL